MQRRFRNNRTRDEQVKGESDDERRERRGDAVGLEACERGEERIGDPPVDQGEGEAPEADGPRGEGGEDEEIEEGLLRRGSGCGGPTGDIDSSEALIVRGESVVDFFFLPASCGEHSHQRFLWNAGGHSFLDELDDASVYGHGV